MLEDKLLAWKLRRGSESALCCIYGKYKDDLLGVAAGLLKEKTEAEDVVHDVFMNLTANASSFVLTGSLKAYLATCVANKARNINRNKHRRGNNVALDNIEPVSKHNRPDHWLIHNEQSQLICNALDQLPYEQKEAIVLRTHGGMKFKEIANMQDCSVATVLSRYRYGIEKLHTLLKDCGVSI